MNRHYILDLLLLAVLSAPLTIHATTSYISDKVMVGIHKERSVDSTIIRLIPSGTPVEVLQAENDLTEIRDPEGTTGWVDNQYLVIDPPAKTRLKQANLKIQQLEDELNKARLELAGLKIVEDSVQENKLQAVQKEYNQLEQEYKSEKLRAGELEAEVASLKSRLDELATKSDARETARLIEENRTLKEQLAARKISNIPILDALATVLEKQDWKKILIALGITLLIGFILGMYLLDVINRHRHGGFRI